MNPKVKILPSGIAVLHEDSHLSRWVEAAGSLTVGGSYPDKVEQFVKAGDVAVDAGACIGDHTIHCIQRAGPTGRVYAFEPNRDAFDCLEHNCPTARCWPAALSDKNDVMFFHWEPNVGASHVSNNPVNATPVISLKLDSFNLERLDWFKIDVEGMELAVLAGAKETIQRCRPVMLVELNDSSLSRFGQTKQTVIDMVTALNYRMELATPQYGLDVVAIDVLFFPN